MHARLVPPEQNKTSVALCHNATRSTAACLGRLLSKLHVVQLPLVSLASAGFSLEDCCITLRSQTLEVQQQLQLTTGSFISPSQHVLEKESI